MAEQRERALGPLCDSSSQQESSAVKDNPHWPYASAGDEQRDRAAGLTAPQVEGVCVLFVTGYSCNTLYKVTRG